MIALLDGVVDALEEDAVILLVFGVGYRVYMPGSMLSEMELGATTRLYIHQHVREDAILLYGFTTDQARKLFLRLQSASGIGPKVALAILHHLTPGQIATALHNGDVGQLTTVPGVGAKTAQRLILELKDRVADLLPDVYATEEPVTEFRNTRKNQRDAFAQVREALLGLGFTDREISGILQDIGDEIAEKSVTEGVKHALRALAR
ncbi:Holliday junction branch migration protein RuvA [Sulfoacidibacillus thermotolerans]|uniref:Holliday junction branch migration complex subunit RuvA n=1 Tax=Sulfoacidibacillus thermotolerans TaxID=1765684 RepID=A0A2U3DB62_SULT2|nr:Holliday junction branch migration protein RuvA [Sulfoacidibacillus thermotolerans]PWI58516.1 Holliday junction DNA helicase RuvA [Sulfoacidibacillus thermotolerans]